MLLGINSTTATVVESVEFSSGNAKEIGKPPKAAPKGNSLPVITKGENYTSKTTFQDYPPAVS